MGAPVMRFPWGIDCDSGIDGQARFILEKLGVIAVALEAHPDSFHKWIFRFTFSGDRELAKYHVETFLADEYNGRDVQFFARPSNPSQCYAIFSIHHEEAIDDLEVKANAKRFENRR